MLYFRLQLLAILFSLVKLFWYPLSRTPLWIDFNLWTYAFCFYIYFPERENQKPLLLPFTSVVLKLGRAFAQMRSVLSLRTQVILGRGGSSPPLPPPSHRCLQLSGDHPIFSRLNYLPDDYMCWYALGTNFALVFGKYPATTSEGEFAVETCAIQKCF